MVYNETYKGINTSLWDTHFLLTIVRSNIRAVEKGTFMAYWDIGYMLLDFMLSEEVIPFCGVDVMNLRKYEEWEKYISGGWEIWESKMMGLTELHYNACRAITWYKIVALGDMQSLNNTFGW